MGGVLRVGRSAFGRTRGVPGRLLFPELCFLSSRRKPGPAVMRHGLDRFHAIKLGAEIAKDV